MKRLLLMIIAEALLLGCATSEFKTYKTLRATQAGVVAAMETYRALYNAGEIDPVERERIKERYERYQELFSTALIAANFDYKAAPPGQLAAQASFLILAIDEL